MKNFFTITLCAIICIVLFTSCEEKLNDDVVSTINTTSSQKSEDNVTLDSIIEYLENRGYKRELSPLDNRYKEEKHIENLSENIIHMEKATAKTTLQIIINPETIGYLTSDILPVLHFSYFSAVDQGSKLHCGLSKISRSALKKEQNSLVLDFNKLSTEDLLTIKNIVSSFCDKSPDEWESIATNGDFKNVEFVSMGIYRRDISEAGTRYAYEWRYGDKNFSIKR